MSFNNNILRQSVISLIFDFCLYFFIKHLNVFIVILFRLLLFNFFDFDFFGLKDFVFVIKNNIKLEYVKYIKLSVYIYRLLFAAV